MTNLHNETTLNPDRLNDDSNETLIDLIFIIVLFGFVSCIMLVNYRLTYLKSTDSSNDLVENFDTEFNKKTIIENIIYERCEPISANIVD